MIARSHSGPKRKEELRKEAATLLEHLEHAGVVRREGEVLRMDDTLQHDFSLHHSLSLFLLDALATLDVASPTYALDVLTWVEAILENPRPVLMAQVQREKGNRIAELKAAGVPYEERMDALEDLTWPKPNGEVIYAWFNAYADRHPWVEREAIRPKGIAREMAETLSSFTDYVNALALQRSEGVLLRYLTEVYKALVQNVPVESHTDEVLDLVAYLRAMLARVDSSLLTEWEQLLAGADVAPDEVRKLDISADRRTFVARVRAELHAFVRALSRRDWEEAAGTLRPEADGPWDADAIAAALAPFLEEFGEVGFHAAARAANQTFVTPTGPHQWSVRQLLSGPPRIATETYDVEGHEDEDEGSTWAVEGRIDLRGDTNPAGPIVELVAIVG